MFKCKKCSKEFIRQGNFENHIKKCDLNYKLKQFSIIENDKCKCNFCGKIYTKIGIQNHINQAHLGKKNPMSGKTAWNKGLTAETNKTVKQMRETLKEDYLSGRLIGSSVGREVTQETRDKISKSRVKFLKENPEKVPYVLNHHSKGESYPEKYFREVLENNNVNFIQEKRESLYSLDFVIGNIDLEIDGEQHYLDDRIVESDIRRTKYLETLGYKIIRIRWSKYQKLSKDEKIIFVNKLLLTIM